MFTKKLYLKRKKRENRALIIYFDPCHSISNNILLFWCFFTLSLGITECIKSLYTSCMHTHTHYVLLCYIAVKTSLENENVASECLFFVVFRFLLVLPRFHFQIQTQLEIDLRIEACLENLGGS